MNSVLLSRAKVHSSWMPARQYFFEQGHVPGAFNLARDEFAHDYQRLAGVLHSAHEKPIIVYCSGGDCHDSRLVANALLSLGFNNVEGKFGW